MASHETDFLIGTNISQLWGKERIALVQKEPQESLLQIVLYEEPKAHRSRVIKNTAAAYAVWLSG